MAGESFYQIAKDPDMPSRQAMAKRQKLEGWQRVTEIDTTTLPVEQSYWNSLSVRRQTVIQELAYGAKDLSEAAARAGVPKNTVYDWTKAPEYRALCDVARASTRRGLIKRLYDFGERDPKPNQWLLEKLFPHEFGQRATTMNIGPIKIGHLIRRDPAHRIPHIIEQDGKRVQVFENAAEEAERKSAESQEPIEVQTEQIERHEPVEAVPLVEPIPVQEKPTSRDSERCSDCGQVPHPGYPHQCLSKRGLPV